MAGSTVYRKYLTIMAIVWAGCLLAFVAAYMVLLKPQADRRRHLDKKLVEKKQERHAAERAAQEETKAQLSAQISELREKLDAFVIDFENAGDLKFDITQIAREKEVAALSVSSGKKAKTSGKEVADSNSIEENPIDVSFISGFSQFASFVNSLERHKPVILVHQFKLGRSNKNESAYHVTLDVRALVRKPQEAEIAKLSSSRLYSVKK